MKKERKAEFLLLLLLIKKYQLLESNINITFDDLLHFLDKFYFNEGKFTKAELLRFTKVDNNKNIIDFLWNEAIINPKI